MRGITHGITGYQHRCRCALCKAAKAANSRRFRQAHPEAIRSNKAKWAREHPESAKRWGQAHPGYKAKRFEFLGRSILASVNPRTGTCTNCGVPRGKNQHDMHHWEYDDQDKLGYTQELCDKCHPKADKLRRAGKRSF